MNLPRTTDDWILEAGPESDVAVSSRARLARNLPGFPFAPRANKEQLAAVAQTIREAIAGSPLLGKFIRATLSDLQPLDRRFLKESHLISQELEKGPEHRDVFLSPDGRTSIMVNEEDHLRMQTMMAGLRVDEVCAKIEEIEAELESVLKLAYHPQFGYLTACPTNTGTGLRVSVMLHLVGLVMTNQTEDALSGLGNFGLTVRGAYGENTNNAGDLFQVSNEVTLGRTEENLAQVLKQVVQQVIERERQARALLFEHAGLKCEDAIHRAIGLLSHARSIDSGEAVALLSRVRLGLGRAGGLELSHQELNRLLIEVQPAHLRRALKPEASVEEGDAARAAFLRRRFHNGGDARN